MFLKGFQYYRARLNGVWKKIMSFDKFKERMKLVCEKFKRFVQYHGCFKRIKMFLKGLQCSW